MLNVILKIVKDVKKRIPAAMACEMKNIACKCGPMKQLMSISRAMDAPSQLCLLEESAGKIAAEFVYLYPPGFPLLFQVNRLLDFLQGM